MAFAGDLREMGDADHLAFFTQLTQQVTDHIGGSAADANVHFVEYQGGGGRGLGSDDLNRQADA